MTQRYTYACTLNWGGDTPTAEVEVEFSFTVVWGYPETPPSYAHGGLPADETTVEDIRLEKVEGKPRPWGMYHGYIANEDDEFATACEEKVDTDRDHELMINEAIEAEEARRPE